MLRVCLGCFGSMMFGNVSVPLSALGVVRGFFVGT
jgi:hypothetical protein